LTNWRLSPSCGLLSTFAQNEPDRCSVSQVCEPLSAKNATSGGSSDTEVNEPTTIPTGWSSTFAVMMATPVG
jgi:hypothetical protein